MQLQYLKVTDKFMAKDHGNHLESYSLNMHADLTALGDVV